jgi:hypothetical protein
VRFGLQIMGSGTINGVTFDAAGGGTGNTETGELSFRVTFSEISTDVDPLANLLGVLIIPTVLGRTLGRAVNLMTLTDGVFEFTQVLSGEGINISSVGSMSRGGDEELAWTSKAEGSAQLKGVTGIEPFEAVMIPQGAGKVIDVLEIPLIVGRQTRRVHAVRNFTFTPRSELHQLQLRHIAIEPEIEGNTVGVNIMTTIREFTAAHRRDA